VLLFLAIAATLFVVRYVLPGVESAFPSASLSAGALVERAVADHSDPAILSRGVAQARDQGNLDLTVFRSDDTILATTTPSLAPATSDERTALTSAPGNAVARQGLGRPRLVVGVLDHGKLAAYAVASPRRQGLLHGTLFVMAGVLALVCVAIPLSRSIAQPLARLGKLARALGEGDLSVRAYVDRRDEIGDLARAFNDMAARVQRLRHAERELLADVSHELRTPLARMRVALDLAADAEPARMQRYLREIERDLAELEQLLVDIIESSRIEIDALRWQEARPPLRQQRVCVERLIEASVRRFSELWPTRRLICQMAVNLPPVQGDPAILRRALDNLLDNARKYSADDKPIAVHAGPGEVRDLAGVRIEVVDQGIGISPEDRPRIFTSFFRADRSRARATGGVGLGLALARRIVEAHGGTIGVDSEQDRGSCFWFVLPAAHSNPAPGTSVGAV
jgi:signal transduction histidine kinase